LHRRRRLSLVVFTRWRQGAPHLVHPNRQYSTGSTPGLGESRWLYTDSRTCPGPATVRP